MTLDPKVLVEASKALAARRGVAMSEKAEGDARAVIDAYLAALPVPAAPTGWKLVPVDLTPEMLRECQGDGPEHPVLKYLTPEERSGPLLPVAFYRAALAAAPPPPSSDAYARGWLDGRDAAVAVLEALRGASFSGGWNQSVGLTADAIRDLPVPGGEHG